MRQQVERVYETGIVPKNRKFEVVAGAVLLVPPNGNGFKEAVCWLPTEVSKQIEERQHSHIHFIDGEGWLCRHEKE